MEFNGRVLLLGCGSVAQCSLPLFLRHIPSLAAHPDRVTVLDFADNRSRIAAELAKGVQFVHDRVERHNLDAKLGEYLGTGDILIDLAWNIDCCEILQWCHDHGVRYLNTSVELWDPYADASALDPRDRSLYVRHLAVRKMVATWATRGPSAVLNRVSWTLIPATPLIRPARSTLVTRPSACASFWKRSPARSARSVCRSMSLPRALATNR